jgi:hypothetical protein
LKSLKLILVFALSLPGYLSWGQCPSVETRVNGTHEERLLLFKDDVTGNILKKIDLVAKNPYNNLPFRVVEKDETYQMKIYHFDRDNKLDRKISSTVFPNQEKSLNEVLRINSKVDVEISNNCHSVVTYGAYGFDEYDELVTFGTTVDIYSDTGELKHSLSGTLGGDLYATLNQSASHLISLSMKGILADSSGSQFKIYDLKNEREVFSLRACEDEMWSCGSIGKTDKLVASREKWKNGKRFESTIYVFDPLRNKVFYKSIGPPYARESIGIYPEGITIQIKGKSKIEYLYLSDFNEIKLEE